MSEVSVTYELQTMYFDETNYLLFHWNVKSVAETA